MLAFDLHKKESQICLLTEAGDVMERRIRTEPQRFAEVLGGRPRARILIEASTESEWVARCLEGARRHSPRCETSPEQRVRVVRPTPSRAGPGAARRGRQAPRGQSRSHSHDTHRCPARAGTVVLSQAEIAEVQRCWLRTQRTTPTLTTVSDLYSVDVVNQLPPWRFLHPTDLSEASEVAFAHALKLTLMTGGELRILHVAPEGSPIGWKSFPGVREALERWGVLPSGSPPTAVAALGIQVEKIEAEASDPVSATHEILRWHPADVIVMATHQRDGFARWRHPSVAEQIAQQAHQLALFVPEGADRFVSPRTGALAIGRILVPVDHVPSPQLAVDAAATMAALAGDDPVAFRLLHVGEGPAPRVDRPERANWRWEYRSEPGDVVDRLVAGLRDWTPDLVVMTTEGHHGFMDALRGSTTERVLRAARCPLLAVSIKSQALSRLGAM
jgi:nucleotide-binding universal stress UspA family protein